MAPNKIQPRDDSSGGDLDGFRHGQDGSSAMYDDNRNVAVLNSNSDRRILDNNWFDNEWNSDNRFLFVRKSLHVFLTNALILWMGAVSFVGTSASCQCLFQFRLAVQRAPRIFFDPSTSPPMRLA